MPRPNPEQDANNINAACVLAQLQKARKPIRFGAIVGRLGLSKRLGRAALAELTNRGLAKRVGDAGYVATTRGQAKRLPTSRRLVPVRTAEEPKFRRVQEERRRTGRRSGRRTGAAGSRLTRTAAPSKEIARKRATARRPKPVATRWVEPTPRTKNPDEPATEKQLRFIASLASRLEADKPQVQTKGDASMAIGRLRQLAIRQGEQDPRPRRKRRTRASDDR